MDLSLQAVIELEQYRCRRCGRLFYIDGMDRSKLDENFGCTFGCKDGGKLLRRIHFEVKAITNVPGGW